MNVFWGCLAQSSGAYGAFPSFTPLSLYLLVLPVVLGRVRQ